MTEPPTPAALIAGVAHLLHELGSEEGTPTWLRAALTGHSEGGLATALVLAPEAARAGGPVVMFALLRALDEVLAVDRVIRGSAGLLGLASSGVTARAGAAVSILRQAVDMGAWEPLAAMLRGHAGAWSVVLEVDQGT